MTNYIYGDDTNNNLGGDTNPFDLTDLIFGYGGQDFLVGGDGNDTIFGGTGNDFIADTFFVLLTNPGNNYFSGDGGNDEIYGNQGNDTLDGGDDNDTLNGGGGKNILNGGFGDDVLISGHGNDDLQGEYGINTYVFDADINLGSDFISREWGSKSILDFSSTTTQSVTVNLNSHSNQTINSNLILGFYPYINQNIGNIYGGSQGDTLTGNNLANTFYGNAGNDYLSGGAGNDTLYGGIGIDTLSYYSASGSVIVNLANGTSWGADGSDTFSSMEVVYGSAYNDNLLGSSSSDTLYGFGGNDTLTGGAGNDYLDGYFGNDQVDYATASAAVNVNLSTGVATGGAGTDTLVGIEAVQGSSYSDTLIGGAGNDTLYGSLVYYSYNEGNDYLDGRAGDDYLYGGAGNDTATYLAASGGVFVNLDNGQVSGAFGYDTLDSIEIVQGSNYNDSLFGDYYGNDTLYGNGGDDYIGGGFDGDDYIDGGSGKDTLSGNYGLDTLDGGLGNDSLDGGIGEDFLSDVSGGDDTLIGGSGNDTLYGWSGNDTLTGGEGNDYLDGYSGTQFSVELDALTGGTGADRFGLGYAGYPVYYQGAGLALITDFSLTEGDKIQLGGSSSQYTISTGNFNNNVSVDTMIYWGSDLVGVVSDVNVVGNSNAFIYV